MMMYHKTAMQYSKLVADVLQNVCRLSVVGCCYYIDRKGHYLSISVSADFYPLVTNGISHPYHLDESSFILRGARSNFLFLFHFFYENNLSKHNSVCLCLIKRTPGIYGLSIS